MTLAAIAAPAVLRARARRGKESPERLSERLGRASRARPDGDLVWMHAVSVGESLSLLPLVKWFNDERPDLALLVTTGTATSAELLDRRLPPSAIHQFAPVDTPGAVRRFLEYWRPSVGLFVESELWPNLILAAGDRGTRLALVSARITESAARGWSRWPGAARAVLGRFDLVLPQDAASASRLEWLGARTSNKFNLKLMAESLPCDETALVALRAAIGERLVVLAASTHPGEEALIADALGRDGHTLLIVAPRHPDRGPALQAQLAAAGWTVARRSAGEALTSETSLYLADTLGELGVFFRLADLAVMGGSFGSGVGGHNPLEAARLSVPIVAGRDVANFAEAYAGLRAAGGALEAESSQALARQVKALLAEPEQGRRMGAAALAYAQAQAASAAAGLERLRALLPAART
jgi:3-deoxy-D-manno-octulosonic-acid transferase